MKVLATAIIDGPEAKGGAEIIENNGQQTLRFKKGFWVAPGAPDVTITVSPNEAGIVDDAMIELGLYDYGNPSKVLPIRDDLDLKVNSTIIVYCKQYTVHFGHGTLSFH